MEQEVPETRDADLLHALFGIDNVTKSFGHFLIVSQPVAVNKQRERRIHSGSHQERRPKDAVEIDDVFTHNMSTWRPHDWSF